jgi:hypothetical protein
MKRNKTKIATMFLTLIALCVVCVFTGCAKKKPVYETVQEQTVYAVNAAGGVKSNLDD